MKTPVAIEFCAPLAVLSLALGCRAEDEPGWREVSVELGSVTVEAIAVGQVEPRVAVPVTSTWGGVVVERTVALGQKVERGDGLLEVRPQLTDRDRLRARRALAGADEGLEDVREMVGGENMLGRAMRAVRGDESLERMRAGAERARSDAELELRLLLDGRAEFDDLVLDWIVRAPIAGTVVALPVELGEPVVPASSFGAGTPLLTIADLARPVFRGTVDELDAGRLVAGMPARLEIGALPEAEVTGLVREVSLLATERRGATVFDVVIDLEPPEGVLVRAGYSAVARVAVESASEVVVVPERLVDYRAEGAFVRVPDGDGGARWTEIEVGPSDGLVTAVTGGLTVGDVILEPRD
ncbi:MAG: HlyD family efflux transporter periplasmic adaptor subunit [Planctomycetota bacterium]